MDNSREFPSRTSFASPTAGRAERQEEKVLVDRLAVLVLLSRLEGALEELQAVRTALRRQVALPRAVPEDLESPEGR
jgi:hypothetical protein